MSDCRKCAEFSWCLENEDCGLFKQKPQTNADRIRSMTDEELAEWVRQYGDCILTHCCACDICVPTMEDMSCKDWILKWLKQEVEQ